MLNKYKLLILLLLAVSVLQAQDKYETRAVWIATNHRLDWPPPIFNQDKQKQALIEIFDDLVKKKMNTVYFQVRSTGTVLYSSSFEPHSSLITGKVGEKPNYDVLEFAIKEAHSRGLEIHAWVNVFRVFSNSESVELNHTDNVFNKHPEWIVKFYDENGLSGWVNPGIFEARSYLVDVISEIAEKYNVDGIHLDFMRYPGKNFNDKEAFEKATTNLNIHDWRRENVNKFLQVLYYRVKSINPVIKVGVAPIGIYKNKPDASGWEGYSTLYQDSREWLEKKYVDYVVPQIYWDIETNPKFEVVARDWMSRSFDRNVILGVGAYKEEINKQLDKIYQISKNVKSAGLAYFRYKNIVENDFTYFEERKYPSKMEWLGNKSPRCPVRLSYQILQKMPLKISFNWNLTDSLSNETSYFSLINFDESGNEKLISVIPKTSNNFIYQTADFEALNNKFIIRTVDKLWTESIQSSNAVNIVLPDLVQLVEENSGFLKPVLIRAKGEDYTLLLTLNNPDEIEIFVQNQNKEELFLTRELEAGHNIISLPASANLNGVIRILYKNSAKEVKLFLQ